MGSPTPTGIDVCLFRERILDVAEEHFRRIGHQKTSVDDMAIHLGVSRAGSRQSASRVVNDRDAPTWNAGEFWRLLGK